jgi:hypothetical protein
VTALAPRQLAEFADRGFLLLPHFASTETLNAIDAEVERLIVDAPPPTGHVGQHFYWRTPEQSPALFAPLGGPSGVLTAADELIAPGRVRLAFNQAQVALNIPPYAHRPGRPHIDGYQPGQSVPGTFTLLVGLLLTDQPGENGGNLWVWPGTHRAHAEFVAAHGVQEFTAYPEVALPEPTQIRGRRGDLLLAHYLLGHNIGGNYEGNRTRRALYWRLRAAGHAERWQCCLTDVWCEFDGVRAAHERG